MINTICQTSQRYKKDANKKMLYKIDDEDKRVEKADSKRRDDKFTWQPADVKVQDENGNWIRGDEFLRQKKPPIK